MHTIVVYIIGRHETLSRPRKEQTADKNDIIFDALENSISVTSNQCVKPENPTKTKNIWQIDPNDIEGENEILFRCFFVSHPQKLIYTPEQFYSNGLKRINRSLSVCVCLTQKLKYFFPRQ